MEIILIRERNESFQLTWK